MIIRQRRTVLFTMSLFTSLALSQSLPAQSPGVDYILDTGVGTFNLGPSLFDANMTWLNSFDAIVGGELLTSVSISFGNIDDINGNPGSDLVTIAILNDPNNDHDPTDAQLLSTTQVHWQDTGFGEFVEYPIAPTEIEGTFFVAVMMDVNQRANPASMDPNSPSAGTQSWMFYNPEPNLDDLGSSPFILQMSQSPFIGAWMIRAHGESAPVCIADFNNDGQLSFFDVSLFVGLFAQGDLQADLVSDSELNVFDVSAFLTGYLAGCP